MEPSDAALAAAFVERVNDIDQYWPGFAEAFRAEVYDRARELDAAITAPLAQGWVMVPTKLTDAIRKAGRIDDADWMCIIAAALAARGGEKG